MAHPAKRGTQGSIYAYSTAAGTRYRFMYRDSAGKQTTKRGFKSRAAARKERERLMGRVHRGEVRVSRESLEGYWLRYLKARRPYLENGSWQDYRRHGELRIVPHLGHRKLTSLTAPELRDWLVELSESGTWAPKTLNNALKALVVCLNHAVADGLIAANPASYVQALPLGHVERDYLRLHEINPYLDARSDVYRPLAQTLIGTGMRISEALALTVADLDRSCGAIIVARSLKDDGTIGSTKSDCFRRVEIGPDLASMLGDQAARRMEQTDDLGSRALLFVTPVRRGKRDKGRWSSKGELGPVDRGTVSRGWHSEAPHGNPQGAPTGTSPADAALAGGHRGMSVCLPSALWPAADRLVRTDRDDGRQDRTSNGLTVSYRPPGAPSGRPAGRPVCWSAGWATDARDCGVAGRGRRPSGP